MTEKYSEEDIIKKFVIISNDEFRDAVISHEFPDFYYGYVFPEFTKNTI